MPPTKHPGWRGNQSLLCNNNIINANIDEPQEVTADFIVNNDTLLIGVEPAQLQLNNFSIGATDYTWDFDDGNFSNEIHPVHFYNISGIYNVDLLVGNNTLPMCDDNKSMNIVVLDSTAINIQEYQYNRLDELNVYRANDQLIINSTIDLNNINLQIFNTLGQQLFIKEIDLIAGSNKNIALKLNSQIYFIVISDEKEIRSFKIF